MKSFLKKTNSQLPFECKFPFNYALPFYHCVSNDYLPHIKHVINYKNCTDFEKDLDYLLKKFEFVDWETFKSKYNTKSTRPFGLLTFDDGFIEFKEVVLPILKRKGVYAINFINPNFVGNNEMMFRLKVSLLIELIYHKISNLPLSVSKYLELKDHQKEEAVSKIKTISYKSRDRIEQIAAMLDYNFNDYLKTYKIYMNEHDLNFVAQEGFGIAAHSWDHPFYYELSLQEQLEHTEKSLAYISEKGFLNEVFAFPFTDFGIKREFFEGLFERNKNLVFTLGTAGVKHDSFSKNLQRIPMENGISAQEEIAFEVNYFQLKKLLNKNRIERV